MKKALVALSFILPFLLLPSLSLAAGFANGSLFLSKGSVTEGDTVLIHVVVSNEDPAKFTGTVVLDDAGSSIGTVPVTLAAGEAQTVSISWAPTAGSHTVSAKLTASDGTVVQQESQTFSIAAKPQPASVFANSNQGAAVVDSSAPIQQSIANVSPQVASAAQPLFTVIDGARSSAADVLDTQLANTKTNLTNTQKPGFVLGTSTSALSDPTITNPWGTFWFVLYTAYFYVLTILRWLVGNAGVFYPVLAILFLYILWRIFRRIRRPSY